MPRIVQKTFSQDLISLAVLVVMPKKGFGSGVFIMYDKKVFFATARHVLFNMRKIKNSLNFSPKTKKIKIQYYAIDNDFNDPSEIEIDLQELFKIQKIKLHGKNDVAVMQIGELKGKKMELLGPVKLTLGYLNMNLAMESMIRYFDEIETGAETFVIGYPKALGMKHRAQYNFNHPLVRKGIVAGKNNRHKTVVIDCPVYGGNSGGPVFLTEKVIVQEKTKLSFESKKYLIGLVTEYIPYLNKTNKSAEHMDNADFGVIVPFDQAMELIKSIA
ncbi:MAG: serine protease [Bacteroidota bacterium]